MIRFIKGKVVESGVGEKVDFMTVLTDGGVGYMVFIPAGKLNESIGSEVQLHTSYVVREDSQSLYGFKSVGDRDFFEKLLSVSGIGPKIAISIIGMFPIDEVKRFIEEGDYKELCKVSGLGSKGAKKIIVDLQGKFENMEKSEGSSDTLEQLKAALKSLGFKGDELEDMVKKGKVILKTEGAPMSLESVLHKVLKDGKN